MNRQILDEASTWFVDFRLGDVNASGRKAFNHWLRRSPEHIRAYLQIAETYADLPTLKDKGVFDIDQLIEQARSEQNIRPFHAKTGADTPPPPARLGRARALAFAATALLVLGTVFTAWYMGHRESIYTAHIGEQRSIPLEDGSSVQLNSRSRIRVKFTEQTRMVELLEGQALFRVARNPSRPFIVDTGETSVRAVGTEFDVYRKGGGTIVTVVEGRVAVVSAVTPRGASASVPEIVLSAGEQVTISPIAVEVPKPANLTLATAWTQRRLIFDSTPLTEVAEEFNRYNERPLVVQSPELRDFNISAVYSSTDPASLVRFLKTQPGIEVQELESSITIRHAQTSHAEN